MGWIKRNDQAGSGTSNPQTSAAFSAPLTPGSLIIVGTAVTATSIATPTDTAGNTYIDCGAGSVLFNSSVYSIKLFYAINKFATASNVISVANPSAQTVVIVAVEFTGNASSNVIDGTPAKNPNASTGVGGGQNVTSTNTTPLLPGDLIVGLAGAVTGPLTIGPGFSATSSTGMEYQIQPIAAPVAATWHDATNSESDAALVVAFILAPAPGMDNVIVC